MPKRRPGEEIFEDGDKHVRLVADFGFLVAVNSMGRDCALLYTDLSNGLMPAEDVRNILVCAAADIPDGERNDYIESLITRYGLQECSVMAQVMLSHAMIGDVKKSALDRAATVRGLIDLTLNTQLMSFRKAGLLWVGTVATSTAVACLIIKYAGALTF